jgi:hypothetical protein
LGLDEAENQAKSTGVISPNETKRFAPAPQVLEIIDGCEIGHFARSFVFNGLTSISFRANRERFESPGPIRSGSRFADQF